ncbi:hypothetical protein HK102_008253, partial [Quaeritorhiza haematococci]
MVQTTHPLEHKSADQTMTGAMLAVATTSGETSPQITAVEHNQAPQKLQCNRWSFPFVFSAILGDKSRTRRYARPSKGEPKEPSESTSQSQPVQVASVATEPAIKNAETQQIHHDEQQQSQPVSINITSPSTTHISNTEINDNTTELKCRRVDSAVDLMEREAMRATEKRDRSTLSSGPCTDEPALGASKSQNMVEHIDGDVGDGLFDATDSDGEEEEGEARSFDAVDSDSEDHMHLEFAATSGATATIDSFNNTNDTSDDRYIAADSNSEVSSLPDADPSISISSAVAQPPTSADDRPIPLPPRRDWVPLHAPRKSGFAFVCESVADKWKSITFFTRQKLALAKYHATRNMRKSRSGRTSTKAWEDEDCRDCRRRGKVAKVGRKLKGKKTTDIHHQEEWASCKHHRRHAVPKTHVATTSTKHKGENRSGGYPLRAFSFHYSRKPHQTQQRTSQSANSIATATNTVLTTTTTTTNNTTTTTIDNKNAFYYCYYNWDTQRYEYYMTTLDDVALQLQQQQQQQQYQQYPSNTSLPNIMSILPHQSNTSPLPPRCESPNSTTTIDEEEEEEEELDEHGTRSTSNISATPPPLVSSSSSPSSCSNSVSSESGSHPLYQQGSNGAFSVETGVEEAWGEWDESNFVACDSDGEEELDEVEEETREEHNTKEEAVVTSNVQTNATIDAAASSHPDTPTPHNDRRQHWETIWYDRRHRPQPPQQQHRNTIDESTPQDKTLTPIQRSMRNRASWYSAPLAYTYTPTLAIPTTTILAPVVESLNQHPSAHISLPHTTVMHHQKPRPTSFYISSTTTTTA